MGKKSKKSKKKKALKLKAKKPKKAKTLLNLKVSGKDRSHLLTLAKKYAGGNLSAWLRHSALNYKPGKTEVIR